MTSFKPWLVTLGLTIFGATCAFAQNGELKPSPSVAEASNSDVAAKPLPKVDPDYVIGVEDVLAINVWREPEMSRSVSVRPDGKITLPLLGEFDADGKTPTQLEAGILKKLQTLVTNPEVSVIVHEIRSQKFNIVGEVNKPGTYALSSSMTVLDAIALAGGFRDFAKPKKMYILRRSRDGVSSRIPVNYNKIIKGESLEQNVRLETRDTLVIP
ncbi:MAG TPA: polysaccharide biosynthesis/export family protein [Terriglobales bacterium]|nr:polysaccharide biosynthesis/export family protein [Terriglobales bacterium]